MGIVLCVSLVLHALMLSAAPPGDQAGATDASEPEFRLSQLDWLVGAWRGPALGGVTDEMIFPEVDGAMPAVFRYVRDGKVVFYEFCLFEQTETGVRLRLHHFNPGMSRWEDTPMEFNLTALDGRVATFGEMADGRAMTFPLRYTREGDRLTAELGIDFGEGPVNTRFPWRRVDPERVFDPADGGAKEPDDAIGWRRSLLTQLAVKDLDRAVEFYTETLGFKLELRDDELEWARVATGINGVTIGLGVSDKAEGSGTLSLNLGVEDIDRARIRLEARGVKFDGGTITIPGVVRLADFRDPDGNRIRLAQDIAG